MQEEPVTSQQGEDDNTSEIARLFAAVLAETTKGMNEAEMVIYLAEVLEGGGKLIIFLIAC